MQYQIFYISPQGHAKEMALSFKRIFPSSTPVIDLAKTFYTDGTIHLIGFEFQDSDVERFPETLINFLALLEYKEILLFATCPIAVSEHRKAEIERKIRSLLPVHCKFHTLYLCQGEVYDTVLEQLAQTASENPFDVGTKHLLEQYRMARGHPNREDIRQGYRVISAAFQLETYYKAIVP